MKAGDIVYFYENWSDFVVKAKVKKVYRTGIEDAAEVCAISAVDCEGGQIVSLPGGSYDKRLKDLYPTAQSAYEKKQHDIIVRYCKEITSVEKLITFPLKYALNGEEYTDWAAVTAYKIMAKKLVGIDL